MQFTHKGLHRRKRLKRLAHRCLEFEMPWTYIRRQMFTASSLLGTQAHPTKWCARVTDCSRQVLILETQTPPILVVAQVNGTGAAASEVVAQKLAAALHKDRAHALQVPQQLDFGGCCIYGVCLSAIDLPRLKFQHPVV